MYETLGKFVVEFSKENPVMWAFLVMIIVASMALALYFLWQGVFLVARQCARMFKGSTR